MMTFEYRGLDADGRSNRGLLEAADLKQARAELLRRGIMTEKIAPVAGAERARRRLDGAARALLYREMALLLEAGLPLVEALEVMLRAPDLLSARAALAEVRDRVRGGESLAQAAAVWRADTGECAVLAAGERAAALAVVLERLAGFLDEQRNLRERALTALLYPAVVAGLALLISIGLLGVALPRFGRLMADARIELPALTRAMLRVGDAVMIALPLVALAAGLACYFWRRRLRTDPAAACRWDGLLLTLPVIGASQCALAALRFTRTLEMLLAGGVALVEALPLAGEATGNRWLAAQVQEAAAAVRHGASLAAVLERIPPLGILLGGWIGVGESGGILERVLHNAGDRLQRRWERITARRLALLEPGLILIVGLVVLLVALAVLLPIVRLNQLML